MEQVRGRGSAILDATFGSHAQRDKLRQTLGTAGVRYCFVEITASDDEIKARLRRREESATEVSDARLEDFEMLAKAYEPPPAGEEYLTVTSRRTAEMTAAACSNRSQLSSQSKAAERRGFMRVLSALALAREATTSIAPGQRG